MHSGGQYEWDSAAPVAVARSAGLHTSRIDGSLLAYNQACTRAPGYPDLPGQHRAAAAGGNPRRQPGALTPTDPELS